MKHYTFNEMLQRKKTVSESLMIKYIYLFKKVFIYNTKFPSYQKYMEGTITSVAFVCLLYN